jgi:hypothetical protein
MLLNGHQMFLIANGMCEQSMTEKIRLPFFKSKGDQKLLVTN